jgi:hypothetical protein
MVCQGIEEGGADILLPVQEEGSVPNISLSGFITQDCNKISAFSAHMSNAAQQKSVHVALACIDRLGSGLDQKVQPATHELRRRN